MGLLPKDLDILPPSDDRVFKLILSPETSKPILKDLISSIIQRPVIEVEVRNSEIPPEDSQEKAEWLDVNCRIDDGSQIDLEMQASHIEEDTDGQHQNLKGKSVYYLCDLHSSPPSKGLQRYDKLARTYQVTFCSYTVFPERGSYVNSFSMRHDEDNALLSDALHVVYVELSKLKEVAAKSVDDMTDLEKWSIFFRYASERSYRETVNKVIESKEALQMAGDILLNISQDERERAVFRSRRMYRTDEQSNLATARDNGRKEREVEIARNLLKINLALDQIAIATGLSIEEVEHLRIDEGG